VAVLNKKSPLGLAAQPYNEGGIKFSPSFLAGFGIFRTFAATTTIVEVFYKSHTPLHVNVGDFSYLCGGFYKNNNMMYTDNETCMADAALQSLKGGPMNRRAVLHAMGGRGSEHYAMLRTLTDELKLISKGHDTFSLTFEGRKRCRWASGLTWRNGNGWQRRFLLF